MLYVIKFLYNSFLLPPGLFIFLLLCLCLVYYRRQRCVPSLLLGFTVLLYLLSTSVVGDSMIRSLESRYSPPVRATGDVIVMLGGGATLDTPDVNGRGHLSGEAANRLLTTAQLYQQLHVPIIISGGQVYRETGLEAQIAKRMLLNLGVPETAIFTEEQSLNTSQNAKYTAVILAQHQFKHPILVTSAFHMARSVKQFAKAGVDVTPYPTDYQTNIHPGYSFAHWWPSLGAIVNENLALKEYIGLLAVRWY